MVLNRKPVVRFQHALDLVCRVEYLKWEARNNCPPMRPVSLLDSQCDSSKWVNPFCFDEIVELVLLDFGDFKSKIQTFAIISFDVSIRKKHCH